MTIHIIATHLVILASLASRLLALFLDRKVSGQAGALAGLEHHHGDHRKTAQDLDNGED